MNNLNIRIYDTRNKCFIDAAEAMRHAVFSQTPGSNSIRIEWADWHIVQRSVGLEDKNGVEMYEGDIVRTWWIEGTHESWPFVVKWGNNSDSDIGNDSTGFNVGQDVICEVTSNIYENPELLK